MHLENFKVVFILGPQRSGTTLTGNILAAHPNVFMIDESDGLYAWINLYFKNSRLKDLEDAFKKICNVAQSKYIDKSQKCDGTGVLNAKITHIVLKAPNLSYSAQEIYKFFSNSYCIFNCRDIRDIVVSMGSLDWIPMVENQIKLIANHPQISEKLTNELYVLNNLSIQQHQARAMIATIKSSMREIFIEKGCSVFQLRYEDLTRSPKIWTIKLQQYLNLNIIENLDHTKSLMGWGPGLNFRRSRINSNSIGQWKDKLSEIEEDDIWNISKTEMTKLCYERFVEKESTNRKWNDIVYSKKTTPIISIGRGGSGTRLMSQLLQSMQIKLGNQLGAMGDSLEWVSLLCKINVERCRSESEGLMGHWRNKILANAADILSEGEWEENRPWGWKLPESMLALPEIIDAFPKAKIIHLVRHPIDSSLRRTHNTSRADNIVGRNILDKSFRLLKNKNISRLEDKAYLDNAATWLYQVKFVKEFANKHLNSDNYIEIKYEDMCSNPDKILVSLLKFLNVEKIYKHNLQIDLNRQRDWKAPDYRAQEVWDICGDFAQSLGYDEFS